MSRPVDLSAMRMLGGGHIANATGLVTAEDGDHYELTTGNKDVLVRVVLTGGRVVWARLLGGGASVGVWLVPPVGAEVLVAFCDGDDQSEAVLVGILSTGAVASNAASGRVVIVGDSVTIDARGSGTVKVNGGTVNVAREGDAVSVSFPAAEYLSIDTGLPNAPFTLTGTITAGTAGDGRFKG